MKNELCLGNIIFPHSSQHRLRLDRLVINKGVKEIQFYPHSGSTVCIYQFLVMINRNCSIDGNNLLVQPHLLNNILVNFTHVQFQGCSYIYLVNCYFVELKLFHRNLLHFPIGQISNW